MCVSPISVKIKRLDPCKGFARSQYVVPCGKCWQCRLSKQSAYFVRSFFEWIQCILNGGFSLFLTLTYNDVTIPRTPVFHKYMFCKKDCQKYFKRVRKSIVTYLCKTQNIAPSDAQKLLTSNLSYLLVSELGEHTSRPHYHLIWHLKKPIIPQGVFQQIVRDSWKLGFTCLGNNGGIINSESGIKYVCKYIGKNFLQFDYYNKTIAEFHQAINRATVHSLDKDLLTDELQLFVENKPFLLISRNYGMFAFDKSCPDKYKLSLKNFLANSLSINGKKYPFPVYYRRKMMYDLVEVVAPEENYTPHLQYILNDYGLEVKNRTFDAELSSHRDRLINCLGDEYLSQSCVNNMMRKFQFNSKEHIVQTILRLTHNFNLEFCSYSFLYRWLKHIPSLVNVDTPALSTNTFDDLQFFSYFGAHNDCSITTDNIHDYDEYLILLSQSILYYSAFSEFNVALQYLDYILKHYQNITQNKQNRLDVLSAHRKFALGLIK